MEADFEPPLSRGSWQIASSKVGPVSLFHGPYMPSWPVAIFLSPGSRPRASFQPLCDHDGAKKSPSKTPLHRAFFGTGLPTTRVGQRTERYVYQTRFFNLDIFFNFRKTRLKFPRGHGNLKKSFLRQCPAAINMACGNDLWISLGWHLFWASLHCNRRRLGHRRWHARRDSVPLRHCATMLPPVQRGGSALCSIWFAFFLRHRGGVFF